MGSSRDAEPHGLLRMGLACPASTISPDHGWLEMIVVTISDAPHWGEMGVYAFRIAATLAGARRGGLLIPCWLEVLPGVRNGLKAQPEVCAGWFLGQSDVPR
jgi:hypothetical protein